MSHIKNAPRELRNAVQHSNFEVYRVVYVDDPKAKWLITRAGVGMAGESYRTKNLATKRARTIARNDKPSVLITEYTSGHRNDYTIYD